MRNIFSLALVFLWCLTSNVWAAEGFWQSLDFNKPIYAGLGFSRNQVALLQGEKVEGDVTTRISADNKDFGHFFLVGMHYGEHLDLETRFQNLGTFKQKVRIIDTVQQIQTNINTDLEFQSLNILLRPKYALGKYFHVEAEAGLSYVMLDRGAKVAVLGNKPTAEIEQFEADAKADLAASSESKLSITYGFNLLFQREGRLAWRWALDWHQHGDEDLASQSLSIIKTFDGK